MNLETSSSKILTFEDQKVLVVDRIINTNNILRLPQEDFCLAVGIFHLNKNIKNKIHESKLKLAMAAKESNGNKYDIDQIARSNWEITGKYLNLSDKAIQYIIEKVIDMVPIALEKTNKDLPKDFPTDISEPITKYENKYLQRLKISK